MKHVVFLVPGFFGFARLGGIEYFRHVKIVLQDYFDQAGEQLEIHGVPTLPTASIRRRTRMLADEIEQSNAGTGDKIHIVGHSTGGLDARFLASSGVFLGPWQERLRGRISTVVTLSTPNFGTPLADFFTNVAGKNLLLALSILMVASLQGVSGASLAWLGKILATLSRLDDKLGLDNTILDYVAEHMLKDLDPARRREVMDFMRSIASDRGALVQLNVEAMDLFNVATPDNPDIAGFSYVTAAPRPSFKVLGEFWKYPYMPFSYSLFVSMYRLASRAPAAYPYPSWPEDLSEPARSLLGWIPDSRDNDGVVPTCSQLWGRTAGLIKGDHLDVCGHFKPRISKDNHTDWLLCGAGFDEDSFRSLWQDIGSRLLGLVPTRTAANGFISV